MKRSIELTDPSTLRALAHPLRLALVGLLRQHGQLTATQAAELLGTNSGSASFHLRQLARYGLVEEVDAPGRQKPWRATAQSTSWPSAPPTPEMATATHLLNTLVAQRYYEGMLAWLNRRHDEPVEWQEAATFGDRLLHVTPQELVELQRRIDELVAPYERRVSEPDRRPEGSRPVTLIGIAAPHAAPSSDREDQR